MKHTQGKWLLMPSSNSADNFQINNGAIDIACVYAPNWGYDAPKNWVEAQANARLIAAAPDMLAMLWRIKNTMPHNLLSTATDEDRKQFCIDLIKVWNTHASPLIDSIEG